MRRSDSRPVRHARRAGHGVARRVSAMQRLRTGARRELHVLRTRRKGLLQTRLPQVSLQAPATYLLWRRGVVVSGVRQGTKLTHVGPGYNWDG